MERVFAIESVHFDSYIYIYRSAFTDTDKLTKREKIREYVIIIRLNRLWLYTMWTEAIGNSTCTDTKMQSALQAFWTETNDLIANKLLAWYELCILVWLKICVRLITLCVHLTDQQILYPIPASICLYECVYYIENGFRSFVKKLTYVKCFDRKNATSSYLCSFQVKQNGFQRNVINQNRCVCLCIFVNDRMTIH